MRVLSCCLDSDTICWEPPSTPDTRALLTFRKESVPKIDPSLSKEGGQVPIQSDSDVASYKIKVLPRKGRLWRGAAISPGITVNSLFQSSGRKEQGGIPTPSCWRPEVRVRGRWPEAGRRCRAGAILPREVEFGKTRVSHRTGSPHPPHPQLKYQELSREHADPERDHRRQVLPPLLFAAMPDLRS